jgi:hypothetical protein
MENLGIVQEAPSGAYQLGPGCPTVLRRTCALTLGMPVRNVRKGRRRTFQTCPSGNEWGNSILWRIFFNRRVGRTEPPPDQGRAVLQKTGNLRACQLLLSRTKLESTVRYAGSNVCNGSKADTALTSAMGGK